MRNLIVHEFLSLDGVMQAPGGADEDRDGGFQHGGWTHPYFHDSMGAKLFATIKECDAFLLGRKTYVGHAQAFEPMVDDPFGDVMNAPAKYVVSKTLDKAIWRNTTIIRDNVVERVRALKASSGKAILTDGSSQLVHTLLENNLVDELSIHLFPIALGGGKRLFVDGVLAKFELKEAIPYPTGVVGLHYVRKA
jgi:dihydrofolate reductase